MRGFCSQRMDQGGETAVLCSQSVHPAGHHIEKASCRGERGEPATTNQYPHITKYPISRSLFSDCLYITIFAIKDLFDQCVSLTGGSSSFSDIIRLPKCGLRIFQLYPCYHYLLRASAKDSHGIDDMLELGVFL